jgi:hypothetical protein
LRQPDEVGRGRDRVVVATTTADRRPRRSPSV